MKLKVTVNGIAYSVDVEVEEEQRKLGSIITGGWRQRRQYPRCSDDRQRGGYVRQCCCGSASRVCV